MEAPLAAPTANLTPTPMHVRQSRCLAVSALMVPAVSHPSGGKGGRRRPIARSMPVCSERDSGAPGAEGTRNKPALYQAAPIRDVLVIGAGALDGQRWNIDSEFVIDVSLILSFHHQLLLPRNHLFLLLPLMNSILSKKQKNPSIKLGKI